MRVGGTKIKDIITAAKRDPAAHYHWREFALSRFLVGLALCSRLSYIILLLLPSLAGNDFGRH